LRLSEESERLFQLDNVADGFGYERRFELFFDRWIIGFVKLSDLVSDPDNERESSLE